MYVIITRMQTHEPVICKPNIIIQSTENSHTDRNASPDSQRNFQQTAHAGRKVVHVPWVTLVVFQQHSLNSHSLLYSSSFSKYIQERMLPCCKLAHFATAQGRISTSQARGSYSATLVYSFWHPAHAGREIYGNVVRRQPFLSPARRKSRASRDTVARASSRR